MNPVKLKTKNKFVDQNIKDFASCPRYDESILLKKNSYWPKISIITPSLNQAQFLERTILSVLNQNYPNLEYIIIDGGSSDESVDIIKKYEKYLAYWVSEPDRGQSHALNKGYDHATGVVFGWLNSDEEYLPNTLLKIGKIFMNKPKLDIVFGNRIVVDSNMRIIRYEAVPNMHPMDFMLYRYGLLFSDATFWTREIHQKTGQLDESQFQHLCMDFDWLLRLSLHVKKWKYIPDYLSIFKEHPGRKTLNIHNISSLAKLARDRVINQLGISRLELLIKWVYFALQDRLQRQGLKGLIWTPHLSTILRVIGLKL